MSASIELRGKDGKESTGKRSIWSHFAECHPVKSSFIMVVAAVVWPRSLLQDPGRHSFPASEGWLQMTHS